MINPQSPEYLNTPVSPQRPSYLYQPEDRFTTPVISIVTPFFNPGPIFFETAQSVFQQSLQQWEWLIVNDGSDDPESLRILDSYRNKDARIRVIDHPENRGLPSARNTGFRQARTSYILYLDSDDLLEPTAAEKWFWFLVSHPEYAFVGGYSVGFGALDYLWQSGFQDLEANLERNRINHIVMIRKEVLEAVGGYDESMRSGLEDWDFWIRCASQGFWGQSIPEYLHWYRTRAVHTDRWEALQEERLAAMQERFRQLYPQLWEGAFPHIPPGGNLDYEKVNESLPVENHLRKEKPRLLIIANWMVVGGAEKFNLDLIEQLEQRGWEVSLLTTSPSDNPWQHEYERLTPDVFPMPNFLDWSDYPRFLRYFIQSRQVDAVLVAASAEAYRLLPYLRFHFPGLPVLDFLHFATPDWMDGGYPRLSLDVQNTLDLSVTASQQLSDWMIAEGTPAERVKVCRINVDTGYWKPDAEKRREVRSALGIPDSTSLILYVARLEPQKQPQVFARTMLRLHQQGLPFQALVIGDGSLRGWLQDFVSEHSLQEQVRILGSQSHEEVRSCLAAGDLFFLPSENEGIALTLYEAMACGLPVVGAAVGGQTELVTPNCGVLLDRGAGEAEVERYARVLAELIGSPERRQAMGQASRQRMVEHFRLELMGERMESLIREAQQLRRDCPRAVDQETLISQLARVNVGYSRSRQEAKRLQTAYDKLDQEYQELVRKTIWEVPMPHVPAKTYFYFAFRQLLYPVYSRFGGDESSRLGSLKANIKRLLVRTPKKDSP